ncbi:MAG: Rrf2 family transcriptional regulator [Deltaproteobacteria bacterium]|nr:Rrf2 family transcriptional regulator [Deltaproteobacteria bacterium]
MAGVIHISEAANLALHTMILMASAPERPLRVNQATEVLPVSENHLAKVLQRLGRAGLVSSVRGPRGGFSLARPLAKITLLEVYEAIEGPLPTHYCLLGKPRCEGPCVLGGFVEKSTLEFKELLERTCLSDVAGALVRSDAA